MQVVKIEDQNLWDNFILSQEGDFLQSWKWSELQESLGRKTFLLAVIDNVALGKSKQTEDGFLLGASLVIKYPLAFGKSYLYCPHGPIVKHEIRITNYELIFQKLIKKIKELVKEEGAIFFRIDPGMKLQKNRENAKILLDSLPKRGFKKIKDIGSAVGQPLLTWQLDISKSEEEILNQMKQKTRYNIRLAQRKEVKIRISDDIKKDFEIFWRLMQETAERDKFYLHPKEHYEKLLEIFNQPSVVPIPRDQWSAILFIAEHQQDPLAAIIVLFFGKQATYLHGGTSSQKRDLMASYLIQGEAIKEARRRGCVKYDFGGIVGEPNVKYQMTEIRAHPWSGITRFKQGFGGKKIEYAGTYDLIFQPIWYNFYKIARLLNLTVLRFR